MRLPPCAYSGGSPIRSSSVLDHNHGLLQRARSSFSSDIELVASVDEQGLSGAWNTGARLARGDVVAFLDDDAEADPGWLEELLERYRPDVAGTGGVAVPVWPGRGRPRWFPLEFDWVVGCSYLGLPNRRRPSAISSGPPCRSGVRSSTWSVPSIRPWTRFGPFPLGCEETEFAIRLRQVLVGAQLLHVPRHCSPPCRGGTY